MRRVHDGDAALLALLAEESHEIRAPEDVEIDGDLVEEQDAVGDHETVRQLDAATLAVGNLVHSPLRVDVEHLDDALLALGIDARDGVEHLLGREIAGEGDAVPREGGVALPVASDVRQLAEVVSAVS